MQCLATAGEQRCSIGKVLQRSLLELRRVVRCEGIHWDTLRSQDRTSVVDTMSSGTEAAV